MSELTLLVVRVGFLLLLWLFIFAIVYALRSDLFGSRVRRLQVGTAQRAAELAGAGTRDAAAQGAPINPRAGEVPTARGSDPPRTLIITSGVASGTSIPLDVDTLTIGRSSDSTLVIVDEYTSTYHARLARSGDQWRITDLDSTNGTRVAGERIQGTVPVTSGTPITIGTTTFELRP